jgi:hypothetical protein
MPLLIQSTVRCWSRSSALAPDGFITLELIFQLNPSWIILVLYCFWRSFLRNQGPALLIALSLLIAWFVNTAHVFEEASSIWVFLEVGWRAQGKTSCWKGRRKFCQCYNSFSCQTTIFNEIVYSYFDEFLKKKIVLFLMNVIILKSVFL